MADRILGYALVGCGRFGRFCMSHYKTMAGIRLVAVADSEPALARATAEEFGVVPLASLEQVLDRPDVDIVHIATPPVTHGPFAVAALAAGKHVLCEKPLAIRVDQAEQVAAQHARSGRKVTVNFILRHSPIVTMVERIIRDESVGRPLRAYFENYAQDEVLPPGHWFWDRSLSGGIFIEHGVHFFDLYHHWFGPGRVRWAEYLTRPGTSQQDRAFCAIGFHDMLATHYHGFDQPIRLDRQRHAILFERGDIVVNGWIPLDLHVHGLVDDRQRQRLEATVPGATITTLRSYPADQQRFRSHGQEHHVTTEIRCDYAIRTPKDEVYGRLICGVMQDLVESIRTGKPAQVTLEEMVESVRMGETANRLADSAGP
jgi:predicted dehydrogenase